MSRHWGRTRAGNIRHVRTGAGVRSEWAGSLEHGIPLALVVPDGQAHSPYAGVGCLGMKVVAHGEAKVDAMSV